MSKPSLKIKTKSNFSDSIVEWYKVYGRHDLPWRNSVTPYKVWISEIMLQQTQVKTAIPYFKKFVRKYPTLRSLKNASEDEILSLWSGLGFYKRARNIFATKEIIFDQFNGEFPTTFEKIIKLPGIGKSTAGAILSIAFNNGTPILDGNVKRIIVRHFDLPEDTKDKELWNYSEIMLSDTDPFIYTQGIMDVGAMICRPIDVNCNDCPVSPTCLQAFKPKIKTRNNVKAVKPVIEMNLLLCRHDNELLLKKIDDQEIWRGLWIPPEKSVISKNIITDKTKLTKIEHHLTHRFLEINLYETHVKSKFELKSNEESKWIDINKIKKFAIPAPIRSYLENG